MSLYYAQFLNPRTSVDLTPISLSDGMAAFEMLAEAIIPAADPRSTWSTSPRVSGEWIAVGPGTADALLGLPPIVAACGPSSTARKTSCPGSGWPGPSSGPAAGRPSPSPT